MRVRTTAARWAAWVALALAVPSVALAQGSFVNFESGHVRPLALSPDGSRLFAVNTPDNRLEIYDVSAGRPDARRRGAGRPRAGRGRDAANPAVTPRRGS